MRIVGIAYPEGEANDFAGHGFQGRELPNIAKRFEGRPVCVEHQGPDVGRLVSSYERDNTFFVEIELEDTPEGHEAARRVRPAQWAS